MKQLVKASAMLGTAQVLALFFKLINTKFLAIFLGPYGVGVFNQIVFFYVWVMLIASLGTKQGIIKYISEYNADKRYEEIKETVITLRVILLGFSLIVALVLYLCAQQISSLLFGSTEYTNLVALISFAMPQAILMDFYSSLVYGFRPIKQISLFMISEAGVGVLILVPLVYFWGLKGAVFDIMILALCQLVIIWWIYRKHCPVRETIRDIKLFALRSVYKVINYGLVYLVIQIVQYLVLTILFRRLIITQLGIEANGIYSPAYGLSLQSFFLIYFTIYIYSFTKISEAKQLDEITSEVNKLLRIALLVMTPVLFVLISYRKWLILLLYTEKFLEVTQIMPVQFLGDFFRVISLAIALPIFARANLKAMLAFDISIHFIFYGIACISVPKYGLPGAAFSYLALYVLYFIVVLPYMRNYINFRFEKANYLLMGVSFLVLITAGILDFSLGYLIMVTVFLLGAWSLVVLTKDEKRYVREKVADVWLRAKKIY
jgi:O-antigen/teichoic acid export membrane protein